MPGKRNPQLARTQIMGQNSSDIEDSNDEHLCITLTLLTLGCLCVGKQGEGCSCCIFKWNEYMNYNYYFKIGNISKNSTV